GDSGGFGAAPPPPPPPGGGSPYGGNPYGGDPYGGGYGGSDPLAGMPPLADIGKRLLARFLDLLVIVIPITILSTIFGGIKVTADKGEDFGDVVADANSGGQWLWKIIALAAYVAYDWLMVRKTGQTLGKKWLGLRVANLSDGSTPDSSAALTRAAVLQIPAVLCCCVWWLILIVLIASDKPYRQGLHDKAA
ncbi:RDD family protein, partial [Streptomyces sp. T-3]|nr:RDD family protein [Streptomyces sp. T-3]